MRDEHRKAGALGRHLAGAVACLVLAACGGSDDVDSATPAPAASAPAPSVEAAAPARIEAPDAAVPAATESIAQPATAVPPAAPVPPLAAHLQQNELIIDCSGGPSADGGASRTSLPDCLASHGLSLASSARIVNAEPGAGSRTATIAGASVLIRCSSGANATLKEHTSC